jgi:flagellar hook assembly protein FlgD
MSSGMQTVLTIPGLKNYTITALDLASSDGGPVNVTRKSVGLLPGSYRLEQNYPNPFNPSTRIEFSLPQSGNVTLTIYDALGRTVRQLVSGMTEAGQHAVVWNGSNEQGQAVSSGVYFYRLETTNGSYSRKMVLVK